MTQDEDPRVPNQWGFTSFPTEEAARAWVGRFQTRKGDPWHIWRLPDGTFDFTSGTQPRESMIGKAEFAGTQAPSGRSDAGPS